MKSNLLMMVLLAMLLLSACAGIPVDERAAVRDTVNEYADETKALLLRQKPDLADVIESSVGYCAARLSGAAIVLAGGAHGVGVCYDTTRKTRTYLDVNRFDVGPGLSLGTYRAFVVFSQRSEFEKFVAGTWKTAVGAESIIGDSSVSALSTDRGYSAFFLSESGAGLSATARLVSLSVNTDLTDTGVSTVTIPNTGFSSKDRQGEDAPRQWNRFLPILGQQVIDEGYDLPLPLGLGLTYAYVEQEMLLKNLEVGLNGGAKESFEFVSFENASANSESLQVKVDAWLFPFMNLFALAGKLDGNAPIDVQLDGDGMLNQMGISCPPAPPNTQESLLCNLLGGNTITLPVDASFTGTTYGIGMILAGGWNNWFVTVPFNLTYADMDTTKTTGLAKTVTPRFGRVLNLGNNGNLALFGGGNYLKTELTVTGQVFLPVPGGDSLQVDYTIDQKNKDPWNLVVGGNWDFNKRWSWSAEYNGFIGSRDAFISSVTLRF